MLAKESNLLVAWWHKFFPLNRNVTSNPKTRVSSVCSITTWPMYAIRAPRKRRDVFFSQGPTQTRVLHICCVQNKLNVCLFGRYTIDGRKGRENALGNFSAGKLSNSCYFGDVSEIFRLSKMCIARRLTLFFFNAATEISYYSRLKIARGTSLKLLRIFDENLRYYIDRVAHAWRDSFFQSIFPNRFYKFFYYLLFLRHFRCRIFG